MRLHVTSLPHTQTTKDFAWCAYTEKVRKFGVMLDGYGHDMYLYAGEQNEAVCAEHIVTVTNDDLSRWFGGSWDTSRVFDQWEPEASCWSEMADKAIEQIKERIQPGDVIGIIAGRCQAKIADAFPEYSILEWGVGYDGILPQSHRCYESVAWQHYVAGFYKDSNVRFFDTVIPNSFDPDDFCYSSDKDDYLLFIGRMTERKGLHIVGEIAKKFKVITAGQGHLRVPGAEHKGLVLGKEKAELFARARAVLVPTTYLEPFGGVAVEAAMSGTPVITTNAGAFTETVSQGVTGYRCSTLQEFIQATRDVSELSPIRCRAHALANYSLEAVAPQYDKWLKKIETLQSQGWYKLD